MHFCQWTSHTSKVIYTNEKHSICSQMCKYKAVFHNIYFIRVTIFYCCQIIEKDITPKCSDGEFRFLLPWEKFILCRKVFLLARLNDQVGRGKLDWHRSRLTRSAPLLRLLHMVVGVAVVVVVHLPHLRLGDLLHLVDGDRHPGGARVALLLSPSLLLVVPAVGQLAVRSADVRHSCACLHSTGVGW